MQKNESISPLIGEKFGKWEALEVIPATKDSGYRTRLKCRCECGVEKTLFLHNLKSGATKACRKCSKTTHGLSRSGVYRQWEGMTSRCSNPKREDYRYYGGKGITVYEPWQTDVGAFHDWCMANGWKPGARLVRIDKSLGFHPDNLKLVGGNNGS